MASYSQILDGLHVRLATVSGIKAFLKFEPTAIQTTPTLYSLLAGYERSASGQLTAMRYTTLHRLVLQWQDNKQSEAALIGFVNTIPAAIDADQTLAGLAGVALAKVVRAESGFLRIGDTTYRVLDVYSETLDKSPYQSGT